MKKIKERGYQVTFDVLKIIGLLCIIFAHADPSPFWLQLRNFDVPLMVMISVWLSLKTINQTNFNYRVFIKKRFKRLVIPTWGFLILFFLLQNLFFQKYYDFKTVIDSFLLLKGIGFIWVVRIYLTISMILPLLKSTQRWSHLKVIVIGIFWYVIYQWFVTIDLGLSPDTKTLVEALLFDTMGYGFIAYLTIWISRLSHKQILWIASLFGVIYLVMGCQNGFLPTQRFKYPVQLYYLSYSFWIGLTLYAVCDGLEKKEWLKPNNVYRWVSHYSLELYLWHVVSLLCLRNFAWFQELVMWPKFILLIVLTLLLTYLQQVFKKQITKK